MLVLQTIMAIKTVSPSQANLRSTIRGDDIWGCMVRSAVTLPATTGLNDVSSSAEDGPPGPHLQLTWLPSPRALGHFET